VTGKLLIGSNATVGVAESCTGGYIAHLITSNPGSSAYFKGGIVAYANEVKISVLGVKAETLAAHGALSRRTLLKWRTEQKRSFKPIMPLQLPGSQARMAARPKKPSVWYGLR
jgi:nicotinamide-nucleotide amidase